jgi:two-component system chemotaxis response regulator CheB
MDRKIKVLVVDDSALMRKLISNIVNKDPDIEVIDTAINGLFALKKLKKLEVDIILLDIEMPEMNGLEFLKMRAELKIETPVIILSSLGAKRPEVTIEALELGAKDFIIKPSGSISMDIENSSSEITSAIKKYGGDKYRTKTDFNKIDQELERIVNLHQAQKKEVEPKKEYKNLVNNDIDTTQFEQKLKKIQAILIGISTGGPAALRQLFPLLKNKKYPVLIVQHMPPGFTKEFAKGLNKVTDFIVKEAENGDLVEPGHVYIAPGDKHMGIVHGINHTLKIELSESEPLNGHKPSVEFLFESAASLNLNVLAIIMTGMGKDGALSLKKLHNMGNPTLAQSPKDCVVFGMPRVAVENGAADKILEINGIADLINHLN